MPHVEREARFNIKLHFQSTKCSPNLLDSETRVIMPHTPDIFVYLEKHFIILEVSVPSAVWVWIERLKK